MEKILSIKQVDSFKMEDKDWGCYDGFIITTSEQEIKMGIENGQSCCEDWGYLMSEDNVDEFIGADLIDIKVVDQALNTKANIDVYDGGIMFINIETSKGVLQFVAYNSHNGYYGHSAGVISKQVNESVVL